MKSFKLFSRIRFIKILSKFDSSFLFNGNSSIFNLIIEEGA